MRKYMVGAAIIAIVACGVDTSVTITQKAAIQRPTSATTLDSVRVHFEFDPDGDGVYQIQYSYLERAGVWDHSARGFMRIMHEVTQDTFVTNVGSFWRDLTPNPPDSTAIVDLSVFAEFGRAFGDTLVVLPSGMMWESPEGSWYYIRKQ